MPIWDISDTGILKGEWSPVIDEDQHVHEAGPSDDLSMLLNVYGFWLS